MRKMSVAALAATLLAGGSTVALAQSSSSDSQENQGVRNQIFGSNAPGIKRDWIPGPLSPAAERHENSVQYNRTWPAGDLSAAGESPQSQSRLDGQNRFNQRSALRRQLRQAGFQNIRILNATYLIQARTPDGRSVLLLVDPPPMAASGTTASIGQRGQPSDSNQGKGGASAPSQQFGSNGTPEMASSQDQFSAPLLNPDQVRRDLQSRGFSDISNLSRDGYSYTATADWRGREVNIRVDGRTGFIYEPRPLTPNQMQGMRDDLDTRGSG
ncbi:hypothetical protein ILT44_29085 [Microvirga sp. BT689]|uniref:hypothetical protein n=1 Tax=Microvirga arvi TaxID=2778731 RepID=UPI00194E8026|nr:hypothetical protein [Microvirga arvi]MBM6584255.1 hypothetical protein [Microvirga arvi]